MRWSRHSAQTVWPIQERRAAYTNGLNSRLQSTLDVHPTELSGILEADVLEHN